MQWVSTSDFEFGVFAFGGRPVGIVALGLNPVGVIAIGTIPVGVVAFGCGAAFGIVSVCVGIGAGIWTRVCGLGLGAESDGVGLVLSVAGPAGPFYWPRFALVVAAVGAGMWTLAREAHGRTLMNRVVDTTWAATVHKSEGLYLEQASDCTVAARLRSDGSERLVVNAEVVCGSLTLASRDRLWDCVVGQEEEEGAWRYSLQCTAEREVISDDDGPDEEIPGLEVDTQRRTARVWASGPPPMATQLEVAGLSEPWSGEPLLVPE